MSACLIETREHTLATDLGSLLEAAHLADIEFSVKRCCSPSEGVPGIGEPVNQDSVSNQVEVFPCHKVLPHHAHVVFHQETIFEIKI